MLPRFCRYFYGARITIVIIIIIIPLQQQSNFWPRNIYQCWFCDLPSCDSSYFWITISSNKNLILSHWKTFTKWEMWLNELKHFWKKVSNDDDDDDGELFYKISTNDIFISKPILVIFLKSSLKLDDLF